MSNHLLPAQFMIQDGELAPLSPEENDLVLNLAAQAQQVLAEHELGREMVDGGRLVPRFRSIGLSPMGKAAYFELDVGPSSLQGKGSIARAIGKTVLHDLSGLTGYPWMAVNHTGVVYLAWLEHAQRQPLPEQADFDWTAHPADAPFAIALGVDNHGQARWMSLFDTSHILVGGESRSGKSTWAHAMLCGLLPHYPPQLLNLALLDAKGVEFSVWKRAPHLVAPVAREAHAADALLASIAAEMDRRQAQFDELMSRDLAGYNEIARTLGRPELPVLLVVMDELTDFMVQRPDLAGSLTRNLTRLASKGAAFGAYLVIITQNPKAKIIDTLIRGNLSTRIAYRVASPEHSRTILGSNVNGRGAHQLPRTHRGRFMARLDGELTEMQGFYVSDALIRQVAAGLEGKWPAAAPLPEGDPRAYADEAQTIAAGLDNVGNYLDEAAPEGDLELERAEWEVLRLAISDWEGGLPVNPLYEAAKKAGIDISQGALRALLSKLEHEGWIEPPRSVTDPRRASPALIELVAAYFGEE